MHPSAEHRGSPARGRPLDLSALGRGSGPWARLRAVGANPLLVTGMTIGVLMVLGSAVGLLAIPLAELSADAGVVACLALLLAGGVYVVVDALRKAGEGVGLEAFARANRLRLTVSTAAPHYTAAPFARGERIVLHSLTTRDRPVVEVGDSWPVTRTRTRLDLVTGDVSARTAPTAQLFLRAVLPVAVPDPVHVDGSGGAPRVVRGSHRADDLVPPGLHSALREFADDYTLEVTDGELTVLGLLPLEPRRPERLQQAFSLIDALAARTEAWIGNRPGMPPLAPLRTESDPPARRGRRPLVVVAGVLALMVLGPLGFAVVMSGLDEVLHGREMLARLVVGLLVVVLMAVVAAVIRWATARRGPGTGRGRGRSRGHRS